MLLVLLGAQLGTQFADLDLLDSQSLLGSSQERGCSGCSTRTHVVEVEVRNFALIEGTGLTPYLQSKRGTQQKHHPPHPGITNGPPDLVLKENLICLASLNCSELLSG